MTEMKTSDNNGPTLGFPRLNEPAPNFEANTTAGRKSLADYKGKWLVLFSHPADFTPVCTTEFIAFAKAHETFKALDRELLGLSIDSNYATSLGYEVSKRNSTSDAKSYSRCLSR